MKTKPGTYALIFRLTKLLLCEAGGLGKASLSLGHYVYVVSAFGLGGIEAITEYHR